MWVGFKRRRGWEVSPDFERDRKQRLQSDKADVKAAPERQDSGAARNTQPPNERDRDQRG